MTALNETHDPALVCAVPSADRPDAMFPIQNLPFGVFRTAGTEEPFRNGGWPSETKSSTWPWRSNRAGSPAVLVTPRKQP